MSTLLHTTTALEAATLVQQGKVPVDGLLAWLERTLIPMSQLKHLRSVLDGDQFMAVIDAQDVLDKASRKLAEETAAANAAKMDSDRPKQGTTVCTITRAFFSANAKPIVVVINGITMTASPMMFSTGSFGWNINGKLNVDVGDGLDGESVSCQLGMNLTVSKSKEAK